MHFGTSCRNYFLQFRFGFLKASFLYQWSMALHVGFSLTISPSCALFLLDAMLLIFTVPRFQEFSYNVIFTLTMGDGTLFDESDSSTHEKQIFSTAP